MLTPPTMSVVNVQTFPRPHSHTLIAPTPDVHRARTRLNPNIVRPSAIESEDDLTAIGRGHEPMAPETVNVEMMRALCRQPAQPDLHAPTLLAAEEDTDRRRGDGQPRKMLHIRRQAYAVGVPQHPTSIDLLRVRHQPIDAEVSRGRSDNFLIEVVLAVGQPHPALVYIDRQL